jgi:ABC-type lipoprotein release transport system permease subunit
MTYEQFESWALILGIGGLVAYMMFIVWDLARKSNAGRFGTFILFFALGLGVLGFIIKTVLVEMIEK